MSDTNDSIAYLNGEFLPLSEARISPMDRGFLFGDGIYEVVPSYHGRLVGFSPHIKRMKDGLSAVEIELSTSEQEWRQICEQLTEKNGNENLGVYLQVSRGADNKRNHAYPVGITPTVFGFTFEIPPEPQADRDTAKTLKVVTEEDKRWQRCNIKSVALLGNVMHYQQGNASGKDEVLLYNASGEVTEGAACNVYIVKNGKVITPSLDYQKLPGITRHMLLDILRNDGSIEVEERIVSLDEARAADEIWFSSSTKEVIPVVEVDGHVIGDGRPGDVWLRAQTLFSQRKYDY
ncbi:MAG: D-amino acid aminotransferase [Pseudomonadales bacterium]